MWPRRSDVLFMGLSQAQAEWRLNGGDPQGAALFAKGARFEQAAMKLQATSLGPLSAMHLVAGSSLARHWVQTVPQGLRSLSDLQALVQSRAEQLFGGDPGWVVAADWQARHPFLCAALPQDIDSWAWSLASQRQATLQLATSLSLALALNAPKLPSDGWVAIHEPEALHLLYFLAGKPTYLRTTVVPLGLDDVALQAETAAELERSSALAGGLPTEPLTVMSISSAPAQTQASAAMGLAGWLHTGTSP